MVNVMKTSTVLINYSFLLVSFSFYLFTRTLFNQIEKIITF